ncbi:hypothetical protein [Kitasatospora sp. NPDC005856]|uniref:hypothetical protein n=1 Tax=Kitasatospora sp. NPDC005856 TaxID=3154566 RepID=UPI0033CF2ABF
MVEIPDTESLGNVGYERVYVELDWYDGPRAGLADVDGVAHYFRAVHDHARPDAPDDEYVVWPVSESVLALEREQWAIFADWDTRRTAGCADSASHPGNGGIDARYDELEVRLAPLRHPPAHARRVTAQWRSIPGPRYHAEGVDCLVKWRSAADGHR